MRNPKEYIVIYISRENSSLPLTCMFSVDRYEPRREGNKGVRGQEIRDMNLNPSVPNIVLALSLQATPS